VAFASALRGKKLADAMGEFRLSLGTQVNRFVEQARLVDQVDRQLVLQRDRALRLDLATQRLKSGTEGLYSELELILQHQDEMHAALAALEAKVDDESRAFAAQPGERQQAYQLVETLDRQLADTRALLTETASRINARGAPGAEGGELSSMVRVLEVHLNAFQYLEANATKLDSVLGEADALLAPTGRAHVADDGSLPY